MRAIRGAITVEENSPEAICLATTELLEKIIEKNAVYKDELVSIIFTATKDLDQEYPAVAARKLGFDFVPLLCFQEMNVKDSLNMCIRVLIYINRNCPLKAIRHIYLKGANILRPDLQIDEEIKDNKVEDKKIKIGDDFIIGDKKIIIMAGPCAVESKEQILKTAIFLKKMGITVLRGGAYKPRTSPYKFQGLHKKGLELLKIAKEETGLRIITEVMDPRQVELVSKYADILQIGSRNMQNYTLLKEVGKADKPVMLKRGMNATYEEFIWAAEYIRVEGNHKIILCERGIRTFENYTRNTLDLVSIPVLKKMSPFPVVIDPSHGTGRWDLVGPAVRGAVAMGADGLIIEVHPEPEKALSDGQQSLSFANFKNLVFDLKKIAMAVERDI